MAIMISFLRLFCAVLIILLSFSSFAVSIVASLSTFFALCAGVSDIIDGAVARSWKIKSKMGAIIDQIIDKMYFYILCIFLLAQDVGQTIFYGWFWLVIIAMLMRDFFISAIRQYSNGEIFSREMEGINKLKTFMQNLFFCTFFLNSVYMISWESFYNTTIGVFIVLAYIPLFPLVKNYVRQQL